MASVTIQTTHNVKIDHELAGAGVRIGSFFVDLTIYLIVFWVTAFLLMRLIDTGDESVVFFLFIFCFLGYHFFWELFYRGQTPGKRAVGIRVVRIDGRDPTPANFLARAIFLLPDVLFSSGLAAVLLVVSGRYNQRLGDMIAGTVVIRTSVFTPFTLEEIMSITDRSAHEAEFPGVQRFTNKDMLTVKHALDRLSRYDNAAHRLAVRQLANRIAEELELDKQTTAYSPEKFLEVVLLDYIVLTR